MPKTSANMQSLRSRVMKFLDNNPSPVVDNSKIPLEKLVEELYVHQIELEMQNEDLCLARENAERIQAKFIDLYDFAPVGYITLRVDLKIVDLNLTAAKFFGFERAKILHRPFTDFIDEDCQDIFYFYQARLRESDIPESCELKLKKYGGKSFYAHLESMVRREEDGTFKEMRISFNDIHQSKLNEIALKEAAKNNEMLLNLLPHAAILVNREGKVIVANRMARNNGFIVDKPYQSEDLAKKSIQIIGDNDSHDAFGLVERNTLPLELRTVINNSNDAVCLLDLKGKIMSWNLMAEKMYGYSAAEAMGISWFDLVPARLKRQTENLFDDIGAGVILKPFETRRVARDGSILDVCITATQVIENGKIVAIVTTERDITEHNRWFSSLRELPQRIIMAQEEERSRISQILHAEFGQALIALKLFTVVTSSDLPEKNHLMRAVFDKIRGQLDKIISDTRTLAHRLSPPGLKYAGLIPAIKELVESAMTEKLQVRFFHDGVKQACFKNKDIIIYRILQEALQNIQKHSGATRAQVSVAAKKTVFNLEIKDNGKGFDPSLQSSAKGLGLALMKQQAALIHGILNIESAEGKGTLLRVRIPIKEIKKHERM